MLNESLEGTTNEWTAIGNETNRFTGKFDGDGHTISGIVINKSGEEYQGLFGCSEGIIIIMNVGVIDSSISGGNYVGGVCGSSSTTLVNCYYNSDLVSNDNGTGATGLNTLQMTRANALDIMGFDNTIWVKKANAKEEPRFRKWI